MTSDDIKFNANHVVALAGMVLFLILAFMGFCVWFYDKGGITNAQLVVPVLGIFSIIGWIGSMAGAHSAGLKTGLAKFPALPFGLAWAPVPSIPPPSSSVSPPASDAMLTGQVALPIAGQSVAHIPVAENLPTPIDIHHIDMADEPQLAPEPIGRKP